jgi:YidC/Oxa1 family membrane protein insertase
MIGTIYYHLIYRPIFNLLVFLIKILPGNNFGLAILLFTLFFRILLFPLSKRLALHEKEISEIQPKIKELQKKYKDDKDKLSLELLKIFQEKKLNPFTGIFLAFLQLPIIIALFFSLRSLTLSSEFSEIYSFLTPPAKISFSFFNFLDLSEPFLKKGLSQIYWPASIFLLLTILTSYFQIKIEEEKRKIQDNFFLFSQYFFLFLGLSIMAYLPSALVFYWFLNNLFYLIQQRFLFKKLNKDGRN